MKDKSALMAILTIAVILLAAYLIFRLTAETVKNPNSISNNTGTINNIDTTKANNITVNSPKENEEVTWKIKLSWEAKVFENTVNYKITDSYNKTLAQWFTTAGNDWKFSIEVTLEKTAATKWTVEIYEISPKDWTISNLVKTNIIFKPAVIIKQ